MPSRPSGQRRAGARTAAPRPVTPRPDLAAHKTRIVEVVEPVARAAGYDLEDLSVVRMGRRHVVRVIVDRDGGVPLDAVADLAREISTALDDAESTGGDFMGDDYQLEVSSPGVDRPLTTARHWRRNVGRLVRVKIAGAPVTGRVVAADDESVTLAVDGVEREVAYPDLGAGRVEIEFHRLDEIDDGDLVEFDDGDDGEGDTR